MKSIVKKVIIYSMLAIIQVSFGTSIMEASPKYSNQYQEQKKHEDRNQKQKDEERRIQEENDRHEHEMKRREHESEKEWRKRQEHEKERHNRILREIGGLALLYLLTK